MAGLAYPHPVVSLAVAMILFEGGLSLSVKEFRAIGGVVAWLVTLGAAITWLVGGLAAHWILGLNWPLAILLGAVLVVTGPTVIGPMLRFIRPTGQTGAILKWESIVIDPIGAMLAVLVFQVLIHSGEGTGMVVATIVLKTVAIGVALGVAGALVLGFCMKRDYIPDYLHNPVSVMFVVGVFTGSNLLQTESGLLSVTIMGFALANQKAVSVQHIVEFKENLRVLLIAAVFILLAAHLKPADLEQIGWASIAVSAGIGACRLSLVLPPCLCPRWAASSASGKSCFYRGWPRAASWPRRWHRSLPCAWKRWGWQVPTCWCRKPSLSLSGRWRCMD